MFKTRIIPVLLIRNRGLYKGIKFKNHAYVGDPINTVKLFNDKEVDELILLDFEASIKNKPIDFSYLEELVSEAFMPIGYGGGIKTIEDAKKIFALGVEKVILNTAAFLQPKIISELAHDFGNQSIVVSIDVKKTIIGPFVFCYEGTKNTKYKPLDAALLMEQRGAGEIILNDIDRDGTRSGYNLDYVEEISKKVKIPVTILGGASSILDFAKAKNAGAHACAAGSLFVYQGPHRAVLISYPRYEDLRKILEEQK